MIVSWNPHHLKLFPEEPVSGVGDRNAPNSTTKRWPVLLAWVVEVDSPLGDDSMEILARFAWALPPRARDQQEGRVDDIAYLMSTDEREELVLIDAERRGFI